MQQVSIRFGILYGGILSALILLPLLFGSADRDMGRDEILGYAAMLLSTVFVVLAMRSLQKSEGTLSFKRAFLTGLLVSLVAGLIFGIATMFFYIASPEFTAKYAAYYMAQLEKSGLSAAELQTKRAEFESMRWFFENPPLQGALMFATVFPMGAVVALVAGFFFGRNSAGATGANSAARS